MLTIGDVHIQSKVLMAPMSGCTDWPFRVILKGFGCRFAFFEMLDASATLHTHKKTMTMLESVKNDLPVGAQILGADPAMIVDAAEIILERAKPLILDLNCACPARKVIRKKCGAYLLKDPKRAGKIVHKLSSALSLPITVKIRSGWDDFSTNEGLELARVAQDNGAQAVFMHGRTVKQGYEGAVDYRAIAKVKRALQIPLIASGDILSPELAEKMFFLTDCDAILVARGALGRPWIFGEIEAHLQGHKLAPPPSFTGIKQLAKKHLQLYQQWRNCQTKFILGHLRKIAMWYFRGLPYATRIRDRITQAKTYEELLGIIDRITLKAN
ncbi:MAG: tRNA dihydrouridine synthase DusB [Candidatus Omnitrophota bacterium]